MQYVEVEVFILLVLDDIANQAAKNIQSRNRLQQFHNKSAGSWGVFTA